MSFEIKDSGTRQEFESGMVRDTTEGKVEYDRLFDGPMADRWAAHLTKAAIEKYHDDPDGTPNWMKANGAAELRRFRKSAIRHFRQWLRGDVDEDHASAVYFNINGAEYVKARMVETAVVTASTYRELRDGQERANESDALRFSSRTGYTRYGVRCCSVKKNDTYDCSLPVGHAGPHCDTVYLPETTDREWD